MFKGLGNLGMLFKQAQQIGGQMEQLTAELKNRRATGSAGGGMVEIEVNGLLEVLRCRIEPQLAAQGDRELLEDLLVAAVNQALVNGKQLHAAALKEMMGPLQMPGLEQAFQRLTGSEPPEAAAEDEHA